MKLLQSKKFKLPTLYLIWERSAIKELPIGIPFIYADEEQEESLIRFLEYELLFNAAIATGYPFNFRDILVENGYTDLEYFWYNKTTKLHYVTKNLISEFEKSEEELDADLDIKKPVLFKQFLKDCTVYVDVKTLKELNVFPTWLNDIEKAIETNIYNFSVFNNNMYNKKLEGMYGALELSSPKKNLIIIDISGSIPKAASTTCLLLSKTLAETFYADIMITGTKTTLYDYNDIHKLNITSIYEENGMNNDQVYFKNLLTGSEKVYETAIVFGDNDSPCNYWTKGDAYISIADAQKICKWKVNKLISLHTTSNTDTAAYGTWFSPVETQHIKDWCKFLNK